MICDLLALRPISHITQKTLSYLHSTKIERMTKTMVIFKRGAIFLCCVRCDPIPPQTSVQRLAHTRNVTTCCFILQPVLLYQSLCARIYLNGDGIGRGTHISAFFVVMRGKYDALLRWLFRQEVTFMLLDQNNVEHVIDSFRPDPNSSSFQRPRRETNIASGCLTFCPLLQLNDHAYVRDDTMFLKVMVDTTDL